MVKEEIEENKRHIKVEDYEGPERRLHCLDHLDLLDTTRKSVPRIYFLSSLTTMVIIALSFAGWHIASLRSLKLETKTTLESHKLHLNTRIHDTHEAYLQDVNRFIRAVDENRRMLRDVSADVTEVKVRLGQAEAKQDLVLEKIKLTE